MKEKALEKWRFAHISSLLKSEQSPNDKINGLQELYGEFGFPEDMASCGVYSRDRVDPLDAAGIGMQKLWQKFKNSGVKNAEVRSCLLPYIQAQGSN